MGAEYASGALQPGDVAELSRFLTTGFGLPVDVECFSPQVLRWKYLPDAGPEQEPRSLIARAGGQMVGHVGLCPRSFLVRGETTREIPTTHPIDWLASTDHPSVGLALLLRGCRTAATQYSIGGTAVAQKMLRTLGFEPRCRISIFHKVLRPIHRRLVMPGQGVARRSLGAVRDLFRSWRQGGQAPGRPVELCRTTRFGPEVEAVLERWSSPLIHSSRSPDLLNDYLRYPGGNFSGWLVREGPAVAGFALLNIVPAGGLRQARIAECFLDRPEPELWHGAVWALIGAVRQQAADEITCFASTPWLAEALQRCGLQKVETTELLLRDKNNLLPRHLPCHVTQLEGDHAYLQ